jgi:hypothetical protein
MSLRQPQSSAFIVLQLSPADNPGIDIEGGYNMRSQIGQSAGGLPECSFCGGTLLLGSDEYICIERCLSCRHSRVLGWFSNEPLLILGGTNGQRHAAWASPAPAGGA